MSAPDTSATRTYALGACGLLGAIFVLFPLIITFVNSFSSVAFNIFPPPGFSLRWYENLAAQTNFYAAAGRSLYLAALVTVVTLAIGTMAAYAVTRYKFRGRGLITGLIMAPVVIPNLAIGVAVFMFFVHIQMIGSYSNLVFVHSLVALPFVFVIISVGFANFDWSLEEAARDLGAGPFRTFFKVLMPQIKINFIVAGVYAFTTSFDQVETTLFLVRPGENTLPVEMFLYLQSWQDPTMSALAVVLILFAAVLLVGLSAVIQKRSQVMNILTR